MRTPIDFVRRSTLPAAALATLRVVVGAMIPASAEYGVPGADDELILADIAASLGRDEAAVREALVRLDALAGGHLATAAAAVQQAAIERFRAEHASMVAPLVAVTARCYYRDDRVMRSIGMQVRPPYPLGFSVEQGDWSLLDAVRERGPIWRRDS